MHRSRRSQMRSPFKQTNSSASSLEGMERPVRSFKSFIKTVPPNPPASNKPLPPAPSPARKLESPPSSISQPSTPGRNPNVVSWKAPAEWFNASPNRKESLQSPPISSARTYFPLLPEPSPDLSNMNMEIRAAAQMASSPTHQSRLLPIYERPNLLDLSSPRTPPTSPLPSPPTSSPRSEDRNIPITPQRSLSRKKEAALGLTSLGSESVRSASPALSSMSGKSNGSPNAKALASLGISSPREQTSFLEDETRDPYEPANVSSYKRTRPDRSYIRGKKLRALNKGSPLAEDSWEDTEMDDKTRQLSFSQDYHDLLVDQYQELSVRPDEVLRHGSPRNNDGNYIPSSLGPSRPSRELELVPPLSWNKSSTNSSPRSESRERHESQARSTPMSPATQKRKSRNIASWVPRRLRVRPKRQVSKRRSPKFPSESVAFAKKQNGNSQSQADKERDLRFSRFFPPSKPKSEKQMDRPNGTATTQKEAPPVPSPLKFPAAPFIRLPGGLAVVRTSPSPSRNAKRNSISTTPTAPTHSTSPPTQKRHSFSYRSSSVYIDADYPPTFAASTASPTSASDNNRSSYNSQISQTAPVAPTTAINNTFLRSSLTSSASSSSHPLSQEILPPPPPPSSASSPPQPSHRYSHTKSNSFGSAVTSASRDSSGTTWRRFRGADDEEWHQPGFLEKAKEVRRRHVSHARQEKLKKSIRVLGPTDPGVVEGYVRTGGEEFKSGERVPGYMVGG